MVNSVGINSKKTTISCPSNKKINGAQVTNGNLNKAAIENKFNQLCCGSACEISNDQLGCYNETININYSCIEPLSEESSLVSSSLLDLKLNKIEQMMSQVYQKIDKKLCTGRQIESMVPASWNIDEKEKIYEADAKTWLNKYKYWVMCSICFLILLVFLCCMYFLLSPGCEEINLTDMPASSAFHLDLS